MDQQRCNWISWDLVFDEHVGLYDNICVVFFDIYSTDIIISILNKVVMILLCSLNRSYNMSWF